MMNLPELQASIRKLLVDDLDLALQTLQKALPETSPKARQVLLLLSQQADLKKGIQRGILSMGDVELRTNQIRSNLLDLSDALVAADFDTTPGLLSPVTAAAPKFMMVYAQADQALATQLSRHFNVLKITGKIKLYNVNEVLAGEDAVARAQQELADTDYILALITVNLFNDPDWFLLVYNALGEKRRVIPIRMQRADYEDTGLEKLRSLPTQNRAVSDFANADDAYTDIVGEIRRLLPKK